MRKKFGQNFLINPAIRQALVQALSCDTGNEVWEIGPGLGAMTAMLLEKGLTVRAFEIDAGFIRILKNLFAGEKNFSLVEGDVMKTWFTQNHAPLTAAARFLLGNLPYNVAASLLADFIEKGCLFTRMVVTVQKEVALRMAASAGSPDYSSFSVLCASVYKVKPLMLIRPSSFYPQPKVDSMGVLLENRNCGAYPDVFYPLVRSLFASRRKTIKNNLSGFISSRFGNNLPRGSVQDLCVDLLAKNGLSGIERAENLEMEVFLSLAKSVENMRI
jgi:16S rRNA (adenine1518-N6/adenine1519-N6)-dimethyltransferase